MAKIYYKAVRAGTRALDSVPERWREQVRKMIEADDSHAAAQNLI